jgi:hypothetical protein
MLASTRTSALADTWAGMEAVLERIAGLDQHRRLVDGSL